MMTLEDLALTVRLARWMGWREVVAGGPTEAEICGSGNRAFRVCPFGSNRVHAIGPRTGEGFEWNPLTEARHAAEVMAEASRKGWRISLDIWPADKNTFAHIDDCSKPMWIGNAVADTWTRAVCLAVLAAAEGGA